MIEVEVPVSIKRKRKTKRDTNPDRSHPKKRKRKRKKGNIHAPAKTGKDTKKESPTVMKDQEVEKSTSIKKAKKIRVLIDVRTKDQRDKILRRSNHILILVNLGLTVHQKVMKV